MCVCVHVFVRVTKMLFVQICMHKRHDAIFMCMCVYVYVYVRERVRAFMTDYILGVTMCIYFF
jgi:hypothetical protein